MVLKALYLALLGIFSTFISVIVDHILDMSFCRDQSSNFDL